ncbi:MAG: AGE family epimerase/isomerase, partial [Armatimonadota bacterium]
MARSDRQPTADRSWFKEHLLSELLPRWLASAPTDSGLFLPHLDRQWRRQPESYGTIVSQGRLLYNFAVGYELTGDDEYAKAVERGARFLIRSLRDDKHGGWFWSCAADGTVLDDAKDSYGHAFVVFGLAHAGKCLGDDACGQAALDAYEVLTRPLRDEHGGLIPKTSRDFTRRLDADRIVNSQNPMMHFFEALLALADAYGLQQMYGAARSVADFILSRP